MSRYTADCGEGSGLGKAGDTGVWSRRSSAEGSNSAMCGGSCRRS